MRELAFFGLASALTMFGCGGDDGSAGDRDASTSRDGGGGGGRDGGGTDGGGGGGTDGGRPVGDAYTVTFGPITVPPGTERTQCVIKRLGNTAPIYVNQIENYLGTSSHHMILYKIAETAERPDPFDCDPFRDTLDPAQGSPLVISQKEHDLVTLPERVGFVLEANQTVRLEMHYINASRSEVTLETTSTLYAMPEEDFMWSADFLFIGTPDIDIPARSTHTIGPMYFQLPGDYSEANFFAITGHEHQYGTGVKVWTATGEADPGTLVYGPTPFLWEEPETVEHDPAFTVPAGGGFKFQCDYDNTSGSDVGFGESANDEMCFFWAYYYPGTGSKVCFTSDEYGVSGCCPGSFVCGLL